MKALTISLSLAGLMSSGLQLPLPGTSASGPATARIVIPYVDAKSIIEELKDDLLPAELKGKTSAERERLWPEWVIDRDRAIRARVAQGDEDSIYNFLLLGTSFTKQPRVVDVLDPLRNAAATETVAGVRELVQRRLDDMITGLASTNGNERLQFVRETVERKGITPSTLEGRRQARAYLDDIIGRVARERDAYNLAVASARQAADPVAKLETQATLYRDRGLSTDTSIFPNFAIEQTLQAIHSDRRLGDASVRRVAIVGPGLDFVDKEDGYDFYPLQSIQPLATLDSLIRLGLASDALRITTFDLSARVNGHLETARQRAAAGGEYSLVLPRRLDKRWNPELLAYWKRIGDRIGKETEGTSAPSNAGNVQVRSVLVRSAFAMSVTPEDLDVVLQREVADPAERFDLIIATNVLVYYDVFEQSLALANIAAMLRPGGLLLSNNLIPQLPATPMDFVGFTDVGYADSNDGDRVFWYQRR